MKLKLTTLIWIVLSIIIDVKATTKTITTKDFIVEYEGGTENYAKASLKILEVVKMNAVKMGFYFPQKVEFCIVKSNKNKLYVSADNPNRITYEIKSMNDLLSPEKSGYNNVYGLCHEMGHLCMFYILPRNTWMTKDCYEGWANYFGSLMIEHVYQNLGIKAWPDQHDYHKSRGIQAFLKGIKTNKSKEYNGFYYSSLFWYNLSTRIGKKNLCKFIVSLNISNINSSNCEKKFVDIFKMYNLDSGFIDEFKKNKNYLLNVTPL